MSQHISNLYSLCHLLQIIMLCICLVGDLSGYVYADNYFELFYNGQFVVVRMTFDKR